jgi:hypothetical protein
LEQNTKIRNKTDKKAGANQNQHTQWTMYVYVEDGEFAPSDIPALGVQGCAPSTLQAKNAAVKKFELFLTEK